MYPKLLVSDGPNCPLKFHLLLKKFMWGSTSKLKRFGHKGQEGFTRYPGNPSLLMHRRVASHRRGRWHFQGVTSWLVMGGGCQAKCLFEPELPGARTNMLGICPELGSIFGLKEQLHDVISISSMVSCHTPPTHTHLPGAHTFAKTHGKS